MLPRRAGLQSNAVHVVAVLHGSEAPMNVAAS